MIRPAFADIFDLSSPLPAIAAVDPSTDEIVLPEDAPPNEVENFIARRKKRRKAR
jgi:hypothetical protein